MEDAIEHFSNHPDYLLTMTQATRILGYKDYRVVGKMADDGIITPHKVTGSKRLRFRYHDVMKLAVPINHKDKDIKPSESEIS